MTSQDRRGAGRCPVCQGPAVASDESPDGIRCRNSSCKHNHTGVTCPRCKATDLAQASFKDNTWHYTCSDCENRWQVARGP